MNLQSAGKVLMTEVKKKVKYEMDNGLKSSLSVDISSSICLEYSTKISNF